jgi:hypothetical protein
LTPLFWVDYTHFTARRMTRIFRLNHQVAMAGLVPGR